MVTEQSPNQTPEAATGAIAADPARSAELARILGCAGIPAGQWTDLEAALHRQADVLVVDPGGWEPSCRSSLGSFAKRGFPPPAVIFASKSPLVMHCAGPAFSFLPLDAAPQDVAFAVAKARRARARFLSYWPAPLGVLPSRDLQRVAVSLERATGLEIRADRANAFAEGVRERMVARLVPTAKEYADLVERHKEAESELEALACVLSVGETHFWRFSGQFRALQTLLGGEPGLPESRPGLRRVWSAGCATGEEVYSLAMACVEALPAGSAVEIVGTDIHRPSLAAASRGVYSARSLRNLPEALKRRHLEATSEGARVRDELRDCVRFEALNLGGDGVGEWTRAQGPFDAIFCRNTLIYFSRAAVERVTAVFASALNPGGGLFLGASETLGRSRAAFRSARGPGCFFYVREEALASRPREEPAAVRAVGPESEIAALYQRGLALLDGEDFAGAGEAFRSILAVAPDDGRGHTGLGLLLANEGRETEAIGHLRTAQRAGPELPETHYLLGLVEERLGGEREALCHYQRALNMDPSFFMARFNRVWILRRLGQDAAAEEELRILRDVLGQGPPAAAWVTGGLSVEALLGLVSEALDAGEAAE